MSKHESWRTRQYWEEIGGLLIEEYVAVRGNSEQGRRAIDGLIVLNENTEIYEGNSYPIEGKEVISIQTKRGRIGMYLLGQAYFSKFLLEKHNPKSVRAVAICGKSDKVMEDLAEKHGVEIVVIPDK
ncbi:MAG: hypothetical protein MRZ79_26990 [Bacteroidia bacterium]|nr:hypothetical protein [Bacteroidia bacterium]